MEVWVLTYEVNEYDQHGEYFAAVFKEKPTPEQLFDWIDEEDRYRTLNKKEYADWIINQGGRFGIEYQWFHLKKHNI